MCKHDLCTSNVGLIRINLLYLKGCVLGQKTDNANELSIQPRSPHIIFHPAEQLVRQFFCENNLCLNVYMVLSLHPTKYMSIVTLKHYWRRQIYFMKIMSNTNFDISFSTRQLDQLGISLHSASSTS